ncbi:MAG TPA: Ig-like domain-containing protein, partial [Bdellovibrionota bacterium]|nr:Ig-like domain-containing protein [Bdellovibrionota bacterium]
RVEFFVDGILSGTKNAAPWTTSWDSAAHLNKTYSLTAKAFDAAGNFQASSPVSIIVNRKPSPPTGLRAERR